MRLLFYLILIEYFKLFFNQTLTSYFIDIGGCLFFKVLINSEFNLYLFHIDIQKNYSSIIDTKGIDNTTLSFGDNHIVIINKKETKVKDITNGILLMIDNISIYNMHLYLIEDNLLFTRDTIGLGQFFINKNMSIVHTLKGKETIEDKKFGIGHIKRKNIFFVGAIPDIITRIPHYFDTKISTISNFDDDDYSLLTLYSKLYIIRETAKTFKSKQPLIEMLKYNHRIIKALLNQDKLKEILELVPHLSLKDKSRILFHNAVISLSYTTNLKDFFVAPRLILFNEKSNSIYCQAFYFIQKIAKELSYNSEMFKWLYNISCPTSKDLLSGEKKKEICIFSLSVSKQTLAPPIGVLRYSSNSSRRSIYNNIKYEL